MKFMKIFWAALLAFIVANILIIILSVMIVAGITASMGESTPYVAKNSVLHMDLSSGIADSPREQPVKVGFAGVIVNSSNTILEVLNAVERAAGDKNIKGIYINLKGGEINLTTAEELRAALIEFKESGKFIVSYGEGYSQVDYYLASVANRVYLNPHGSVSWSGLHSNVIFFKGLMDKLGVEVEIMRVGTFKAAVEPFMLDKMSPENRLQTTTLLETMWGSVLHGVSVSRGIDSAVLSNYATDLALNSAAKAFEYGFVDNLIYEDQVLDIVARLSKGEQSMEDAENAVITSNAWEAFASRVGEPAVVQQEGDVVEEIEGEIEIVEEDKKEDKEQEAPTLIALSKYISATEADSPKRSKNVVAIVYVDGSIVDGVSNEGSVGGESVAKKLVKVRENDDIKALVLRVNSPGGSAMASEIMWRELELIRKTKPIIVSMGSMAASGGYYVSCPADVILANRTTLTGSIGVFGLLPNISKGLKDKLGVTVDVVRTNPSADMMSMFRGVTPREKDMIMVGVKQVYETFIGHVAAGRNMSTEQVDNIGGGRIWSGVSSLEIGLIDDFGGFKDAIALAADRAGISEDFRVRQMVDKPKGLMEMLQPFIEANVEVDSEFSTMWRHYKTIKEMALQQGVQARIPYLIEIK